MTDRFEEHTFEQRMTRLELVVKQLESGEASLERSLQLFEEGVILARELKNELDRTEERIEQVLLDENGHVRIVTLEVNDEA